jgi:hypothetical protein
MKDLHNRLSVLKIILNSSYGDGKITSNVYEESYKIRHRIGTLKSRKEKIKRIWNL